MHVPQTSKPSSGVSPERTGLLPFASLVICSFPFLSTDSHAQPEPNRPTAAALNSFLKFSKLPKSRLMASASFSVGSLCEGLGRELQEIQCMVQHLPGIIKYGTVGAVATMVTQILFSYSVPGTRLFRLFYVCL